MAETAHIYCVDDEGHIFSSHEHEFASLDELRLRLEADLRACDCALIEVWEGGVCVLRLRRGPSEGST